jgi:UDP-2,4-diacetamido-2,4,6-trideoxy-beta-L-altropyranose hydrolase
VILIFTEALKNTGLGHLTRCTALAEILTEIGHAVKIILHSDGVGFDSKQSAVIHPADWKDIAVLENILNSERMETSVVDSYLAPLEVYKKIKANSSHLVCIDDNCRIEYPMDSTILNPGLGGEFAKYPNKQKSIYTGLEYALLREPFRNTNTVLDTAEKIQTIMITTGGEDRWNLIPEISSMLAIKYEFCRKIIIVASAFANIKEIRDSTDERTYIYQNIDAIKMHRLMCECDIAITAGGQTTYELASCRIPMIVIRTAMNQNGNIKGWQAAKIIDTFGKPDNAKEFILNELIRLQPASERKKRKLKNGTIISSVEAFMKIFPR